MRKKFIYLLTFLAVMLVGTASTSASTSTSISDSSEEIVVYSARAEHLIKPIFDEFTKETGIKITLLTANSNALIERLKLEGAQTPADLLLTVDAGNLWYAANQGLFQTIDSELIEKNVPAHLRDPNNLWIGLSIRARTIVYNNQRLSEDDLTSYADLAKSRFKGRLCLRTAKKVYSKSLVASLLHHLGEVKTREILKGWVDNLATIPMAKDNAVMQAIMAGQCDVGLVNSYYYVRLKEKKPTANLALFWANQAGTGTHVNVSGAGLLKGAKHKKAALKLLKWLTNPPAQALFAKANKEYPVNPIVSIDESLTNLGTFKQDTMNLSYVGKLQEQAVILMQQAGYL